MCVCVCERERGRVKGSERARERENECVCVRARDSIMMCETCSKCERFIIGGGKGVDDIHLRQEQS